MGINPDCSIANKKAIQINVNLESISAMFDSCCVLNVLIFIKKYMFGNNRVIFFWQKIVHLTTC